MDNRDLINVSADGVSTAFHSYWAIMVGVGVCVRWAKINEANWNDDSIPRVHFAIREWNVIPFAELSIVHGLSVTHPSNATSLTDLHISIVWIHQLKHWLHHRYASGRIVYVCTAYSLQISI